MRQHPQLQQRHKLAKKKASAADDNEQLASLAEQGMMTASEWLDRTLGATIMSCGNAFDDYAHGCYGDHQISTQSASDDISQVSTFSSERVSESEEHIDLNDEEEMPAPVPTAPLPKPIIKTPKLDVVRNRSAPLPKPIIKTPKLDVVRMHNLDKVPEVTAEPADEVPKPTKMPAMKRITSIINAPFMSDSKNKGTTDANDESLRETHTNIKVGNEADKEINKAKEKSVAAEPADEVSKPIAVELADEVPKPTKIPAMKITSILNAPFMSDSKNKGTTVANDESFRETHNNIKVEGAADKEINKAKEMSVAAKPTQMPAMKRITSIINAPFMSDSKNRGTTDANDESSRETHTNIKVEGEADEEMEKKRPSQNFSHFRNPFIRIDRNSVDDNTKSGRGTPTTDIELAEEDDVIVHKHKPPRHSLKDFYETFAMSLKTKSSEPSWWKQRWAKVLIAAIFVLLIICALMAIVIGVIFAQERSGSGAGPQCFLDNLELRAAAIRYVKGGCGAGADVCVGDSEKYGWPIGSWCVYQVTDMSNLFQGLDTFNEDISQWDVGQVTDMSRMFYKAEAFRQDLSDWDVGKVSTMAFMFYGALSFDSYISVWNTTSVTDMRSMFAYASSFNQAIAAWDTSSVTDMNGMFLNATSFDRNLCAWGYNFPYNNAIGIFGNSGCTFQDEPQLEGRGPFCASSCV